MLLDGALRQAAVHNSELVFLSAGFSTQVSLAWLEKLLADIIQKLVHVASMAPVQEIVCAACLGFVCTQTLKVRKLFTWLTTRRNQIWF